MDSDEIRQTQKDVGIRLGHRVSIRKLEKVSKDGQKTRTHKRYNWRCSYVEEGKRATKYFRTKADAELWAEQREREALSFGTDAVLTPAERSAVIDTRTDLVTVGLSLRQAVAFAVESHRRARNSCTVKQLAERAVASRAQSGLSHTHVRDMKGKLTNFSKVFGARSLVTITTKEVEDWLYGLKLAPASLNSYRRILVVAFNDAKRDGHIDENPAEKVRPAKVVESEVGIITPAEAAAMLAKADPEIRPAIALGLFAGLRMSELEQLDWSEIHLDFGNLQVKAAKAKSGKNRLVTIPDNLAAWLRESPRRTGSVWPESHQRGRKMMEAARRAAGYGTAGEVRKAELVNESANSGKVKGSKAKAVKETAPVPRIRKWPDNALRHSYATYHLAHHENANSLALELGHVTTALIFAHYRRPVSKDEAQVFWSIVPGNAKALANQSAAARDSLPSPPGKGLRTKR